MITIISCGGGLLGPGTSNQIISKQLLFKRHDRTSIRATPSPGSPAGDTQTALTLAKGNGFWRRKKEYGPRYKKREITATIVEGWKNDTCCMGVLRESKSAACSIIISNIIIMFICVFYDCFLQSKSIFSWCGETSRLDIAASWSKDKKLAGRII